MSEKFINLEVVKNYILQSGALSGFLNSDISRLLYLLIRFLFTDKITLISESD